jgi:AcrR family transcriptional regulator
MDVKNKKVLQSESTRAELIRVASDLFAERGYPGAALEDMAKKAGLTKGALYHHFRDKRALFQAVVRQVLEDDLRRIQAESKRMTAHLGANSWDRLIVLTDLFLEGFLDPRQRRIVWVDGPAVLGWERWHQVVSEPTIDRMVGIFGVLKERGVIEPGFQRPLAQLMFGAVQEAGMAIAYAPDQEARRAEVTPALHWMLETLFRAGRPERRR